MNTLEYWLEQEVEIEVNNPEEIKIVVDKFVGMGAKLTWELEDHLDLLYIYLWESRNNNVEVHGALTRSSNTISFAEFIAKTSPSNTITTLRKLNAGRFT